MTIENLEIGRSSTSIEDRRFSDDTELKMRIRDEIRKFVRSDEGLNIEIEGDAVILTGTVLQDDIDVVIDSARAVTGERELVAELDVVDREASLTRWGRDLM